MENNLPTPLYQSLCEFTGGYFVYIYKITIVYYIYIYYRYSLFCGTICWHTISHVQKVGDDHQHNIGGCNSQWIGLREQKYRKAPYKKWEKPWFPVDSPFHQSIEIHSRGINIRRHVPLLDKRFCGLNTMPKSGWIETNHIWILINILVECEPQHS